MKSAFRFTALLLVATGNPSHHLFAQTPPPPGDDRTEVQIRSRIGTPLINDGVTYFGTEEGIVYAMDSATGQELWRFQTEAPLLNRPLVEGGTLYIGGQDGQMRAIDTATGRQRWSFQAGAVDWPVRDIFINGTPTVQGGVLYFSSEDFNVYAVDADTGVERWRRRLGEEPQALEIPLVNGVGYIGAWDGHVYAINMATGELVWRSQTDNDHVGRTVRDTSGELIWISDRPNGETRSNQAPYVTVVPIVAHGSVYFTDWAGNLMAVDAETGKQRWRFHPATENRRHVGSRSYFALFDDVLYYATLEDMHLYGVDALSGAEVWRYRGEGMLYGPMYGEEGVALYGEILLDSANQPSGALILRALDLETRSVLWSTADASAFPFVKDGTVYYGGSDGTVHGRDLRTGREVWRLGRVPPR